MSIRKVSDLKPLSKSLGDFDSERFKTSLLEVSYDVDGLNGSITRYESRYMVANEFISELCSQLSGITVEVEKEYKTLSTELCVLEEKFYDLSDYVYTNISKLSVKVDNNTRLIYELSGQLTGFIQGSREFIITENSPD